MVDYVALAAEARATAALLRKFGYTASAALLERRALEYEAKAKR